MTTLRILTTALVAVALILPVASYWHELRNVAVNINQRLTGAYEVHYFAATRR